MEHGRKGTGAAFLPEDAGHVGVGFAAVDDERQSGFARRGDVRPQPRLLRLARAEMVMIVEPRLPDRDDLGMARALDEFGDRNVELFMRVVWMRSRSEEHTSELQSRF